MLILVINIHFYPSICASYCKMADHTGTMSTKIPHLKEGFSTLKPVCDAFIIEPNDVNTKHLKNAIAMVPEYALEQLQPYVLIPLEIHLDTKKCV